jgi:HlyD family secretion protein
MASTTLTRNRGAISGRWLVGGIALIVAAIVAALWLSGVIQRPAPAAPATVPVTKGALVAAVSGSGSVAAEQSLDVAFQTSGTVTQVLVKNGDAVQAGQALARLDDRQLQSQVASAQAALESARAHLLQSQQGDARPEDLAAARAALSSAQASFDKLMNGPTPSDLASAQAAVQSAQTAYAAAVNEAGTTSSQLDSDAAAVQKDQAAVQQAQAAYDQVAMLPNIGMMPQSLTLQQDTVAYQQARADYESLSQTAGSDAQSKVDSAAAQLAQAKASLANLTPLPEDVAVAQANLDTAKANLAKLTAPATATDLQIQQAAVAQAAQALQQAQISLDQATLRAPFAGVVSEVSIVPGSLVLQDSSASPTSPVLLLTDRNPLHVELKLSENDVAQVQLGQPVKLTIQALDGWQADGKVSYIAPAADSGNGVVTYAVWVTFPGDDTRVKVGMTADLDIVTARKEDVLLVPNASLLPKGAGHVVQVASTDAQGRTTTREVDVQTGLTDGSQTEIVSGLSEGQRVIALPDNGAPKRSGGMFGG